MFGLDFATELQKIFGDNLWYVNMNLMNTIFCQLIIVIGIFKIESMCSGWNTTLFLKITSIRKNWGIMEYNVENWDEIGIVIYEWSN